MSPIPAPNSSLRTLLSRFARALACALLPLLALTPLAHSQTAVPEGWREVGPFGGPVTSLAVAETGASSFIGPVVFAGTRQGVLRSVDGGETWERPGPLNAPVVDLQVDPDAFRTLYVLAAPGEVAADLPPPPGTEPPVGRLLRSVDGGEIFQEIDSPNGFALALAPSDPERIYLGLDLATPPGADDRGLAYTLDGGETWQTTTPVPGLHNLLAIAVDPEDADRVFVGGSERVSRTTDRGESWRAGVGANLVSRVTSLAVSPHDSQRIWAAGFKGVMRSDDGGLTWQKVREVPFLRVPLPHFIVADPRDADTAFLVAAPGECAVTRDSGSSWDRCQVPVSTPTDLAVAPGSSGILWAAGPRGVVRSLNTGDAWADTLETVPARRIQNVLAVASEPTSLLALEDDGTLHFLGDACVPFIPSYDDPASEWVPLFPAAALMAAMPSPGPGPEPEALVYVGAPGSPLWTVDRDFQAIANLPFPQLQLGGGEQLIGNALAVDPRDADTLWVATSRLVFSIIQGFEGTHHLWRSQDGGVTWTDLGQDLPRVVSLAVDPRLEDTVYAGTEDGLYVSRDNGVTWTATRSVGGPDPLPSLVEHIALDATAPGRLLFAGGGAVARSDDAGATATLLRSRGLPAGLITGLLADLRSGRFHAVVAGHGVFTTPNSGGAWLDRNGRRDPTSFTGGLTVDPNLPGFLWAATTGGAALLAGSPPCVADGDTLCLEDGRFRVEAAWEDFQDGRGDGRTFPLTADTGAFWFFAPDNLELVVKVLDAEPVNGHFWVFAGALTNVPYTLLVEDSFTDRINDYDNPSGRFASFGDTVAFPVENSAATGGAQTAAAALETSSGGVLIPLPAGAVDRTGEPITPVPPCRNDGGFLCLNGFGISVTWKDFQGGSGSGESIPLTDDTGGFWFFDPDNVELMVKVIDGTEINGHHWLFLASLTNVEFTVRITGASGFFDTEITNPAGTFASRAVLDEL